MKNTIIQLYSRELDKLTHEIEAYKKEASLWKLDKEVLNCSGNLCLHLIGNLHHFIGALLGNTGYVRKREAEFSTKDVPKATLLEEIQAVKQTVIQTLESLSDQDIMDAYPIQKNGETVTTYFMLLHLISHLSYHIGQINYHRRLLDC